MCSALTEIGADLEKRKISECKIDPTSASVVGGIVLWTQDKKYEERDAIFYRASGCLCESTIIID
jgi:hypothetical protein